MNKRHFAASVTLLLLSIQVALCTSGKDSRKPCATTTSRKGVARRATPAYLSYMPFDVQTSRAISRERFIYGLHATIRNGFDPAAAKRIGVVRLTSPADISTFKSLLKDSHNMTNTAPFGEPRLLFEADNGETQIFVCAGGSASRGTHQWQMSPQDSTKLRQMLNHLYPEAPQ